MPTTCQLTADFADLLGADALGVVATIETNLPAAVALVDQDGNEIRMSGPTRITLSPGQSFDLTLIATDSPDINVIDGTLRYLVRLTYRDPAGNRRSWESGYFELTSDADLSDIAGSAYSAPELGGGGGGGLTEADIAFLPGTGNTATGIGAHAEGINTTASADGAHANGSGTTASGLYSFAEGQGCVASGLSSHAEGGFTTASGAGAHAEGSAQEASGQFSHAEGDTTIASGVASHAEGQSAVASALASHAEGRESTASAAFSHAEGAFTAASGYAAHAEGDSTTASADSAHAEGYGTIASGNASHAEGDATQAVGAVAHAEGSGTIASGDYSHAEGSQTVASGTQSHAEGNQTVASGGSSHAQGARTIASGLASYAGGIETRAFRVAEHTHGYAPTGTSGLQRSNVCQDGFISAGSGAGPALLEVHAGKSAIRFVVMTDDGLVRWDIYASASNSATSFANRDTGTVTILAQVGGSTPTYGTTSVTWTVSGNSSGQVVLTPSAAIGRLLAAELFEMGPVL